MSNNNTVVLDKLTAIEKIINRILSLIEPSSATITTTASVIQKGNGVGITPADRYKNILLESIINESKNIQGVLSACQSAKNITPDEVLKALQLQVSANLDGDAIFREKYEKLDKWTKDLKNERIKVVASEYETGKKIANLDSMCASFNLTRQDLIECFQHVQTGVVEARDPYNFKKYGRLKDCVSSGVDFTEG